MIVTSGGYTRRSHQLVAELAVAVAERLAQPPIVTSST